MQRVALSVALCAVAASCGTSPNLTPTGARSDEVIVTAQAWDRGVTVSVGETIRVPPPAAYETWTVHPSTGVVRALDSSERQRRPGADGWRFEAVQAGASEIAFVPFVGVSDDRAGAAAPSQPRFTLTVTVR